MKGNTNRMKGKMKDLLFIKKMHLPVFTAQKLESMSNEEWDFEHQQVCDDNVYNHITSEIHAMTLWDKIESLYVSKCGNNKLFLLNSIVSLKFSEGTSLSDHLNKLKEIIDQMSGMGIKFEDKILRLLLLNSLPKS
ncbi:hypothetical protein CR513_10416, partial [Mucuna pruriens]